MFLILALSFFVLLANRHLQMPPLVYILFWTGNTSQTLQIPPHGEHPVIVDFYIIHAIT